MAPLDTPSVLVDLDILDRNIRRMADFAAEHGVKLRPHAKSHKTAAIARRQLQSGAIGLTVAKLDEAEAFVHAGFDDLFVANQVIGPLKWRRLAELQSHGTISVGVDSIAGARGIAEAAVEAATTVPVVIEIDTGLHRAGVPPGEPALALARQIASLDGLELRGVFTHAGHAYAAASPQEVQRIGRLEGELVVMTADVLRAHGIACPVVSVGSTPTAMIAGAIPGVTEIRPGNYVFYDRMQVGLGSAQRSDCALTVLTTVISRPSPDRAVIDAGSKTFALDRGAHGLEALLGYGEDNEFGLVLDHLSEEHGVILLDPARDAMLHVGDRLRILPNHACTTANLAEALYGMRDGRLVEVLPVLVRGGGHRGMGAEDRLRCAVLGSGFAGSTFAESISYAPDAELVAIAGGRNAPELAARFAGARAVSTRDVDDLLDSDLVDAVLIASPNPAHCPQTVRAAASGKHVLVEKPMALNVGECRAMIDACQRAGVVLMVGQHHRFRRNPIAAQLLLQRGAIGKVDMVQMLQTEPDVTTWLTTPANGGYLLGGGVHGLDLLRWWLGDVDRVCALTGQYRGEQVENGSLLLLEFANGAHASFGYSVIPGSVPPPGSGVVQFEVRLTGETGAMHVDMYGDVKLSTPTGWDVQTTLPVWQGHYAFLRMEAYASQAREFVAAIREHRPPRYAAEEALLAVAIVEAAHLSARDRRWVHIRGVLDAAQ